MGPLQITESSLQMERGRGLAKHQDGKVIEALASAGLWKPCLRNLDFHIQNYGKVVGRL